MFLEFFEQRERELVGLSPDIPIHHFSDLLQSFLREKRFWYNNFWSKKYIFERDQIYLFEMMMMGQVKPVGLEMAFAQRSKDDLLGLFWHDAADVTVLYQYCYCIPQGQPLDTATSVHQTHYVCAVSSAR